jgi:hypothetical protein
LSGAVAGGRRQKAESRRKQRAEGYEGANRLGCFILFPRNFIFYASMSITKNVASAYPWERSAASWPQPNLMTTLSSPLFGGEGAGDEVVAKKLAKKQNFKRLQRRHLACILVP